MEADGERKKYREGWQALTWMMDRGVSWSGHERNCVYMNKGDGTFVDVSGLSGCDFADDGRAVVYCDWDGDGDLDLWLRNRSAPQLRYMENRSPASGSSITIRLRGAKSNPDAVGARVTLSAGSQRIMRAVNCGSGYLSQSTREIVLTRRAGSERATITVEWPSGQTQSAVAAEGAEILTWVEGATPVASTRTPRVLKGPLASRALSRGIADTTGRVIVLRTPLMVPPSILTRCFNGKLPARPTYLAIWAEWCNKCQGEIGEFAGGIEKLEAMGLDVLLLNADKVADRRDAFRFLSQFPKVLKGDGAIRHQFLAPKQGQLMGALAEHVLGRSGDLPLPFGWLIDETGRIQAMSIGRVGLQSIMHAQSRVKLMKESPSHRTLDAGRFYFFIPRDLPSLSARLLTLGFRRDAAFYSRARNAASGGSEGR